MEQENELVKTTSTTTKNGIWKASMNSLQNIFIKSILIKAKKT